MTVEPESYIAWIEQAVVVTRTLGCQMKSCRQEFMAMRLDGMYHCISEQEQSCRQLQELYAVADSMRNPFAAPPGPGRAESGPVFTDRCRSLLTELTEARAEVACLNHVQAAYLRRCGRTVNILMNALGLSGPTYMAERLLPSSRAVGAG
jgi:hypothetical protein